MAERLYRDLWQTRFMPAVAKEFIVYVSTNIGKGCPFEGCDFSIGLERFEQSCNHLIQQHGLKCLHVGQEPVPTTPASRGTVRSQCLGNRYLTDWVASVSSRRL
jgi:hypothetical protein